ncbi:hypothetical protein F5Y16DRAFT_378954 [Xylariaceae sp. FL0255]|nr:hypothetical protein F5Y16DRAFT_378954 [Xylariaceae sp. FL0255]
MDANSTNFYFSQSSDDQLSNTTMHEMDAMLSPYLDFGHSNNSKTSVYDTYVDSLYPSSVGPSPSDSSQDHLTAHEDENRGIDTEEQPNPSSKPPPKRKRENRYKNAPPSVLSRRRAQNRQSQRAYRERKDQRIKDLEGRLEEVQQQNDSLTLLCTNLQTELLILKSEEYSPTLRFDGFRTDNDAGLYLQDDLNQG